MLRTNPVGETWLCLGLTSTSASTAPTRVVLIRVMQRREPGESLGSLPLWGFLFKNPRASGAGADKAGSRGGAPACYSSSNN
jgi:hypothetical protein